QPDADRVSLLELRARLCVDKADRVDRIGGQREVREHHEQRGRERGPEAKAADHSSPPANEGTRAGARAAPSTSSISWTLIAGKKRKKRMSRSGIAAADPAVIVTSTHVGAYRPQSHGMIGSAMPGTTIRKRLSHMPPMIRTEEEQARAIAQRPGKAARAGGSTRPMAWKAQKPAA